MMHDLLLPIPQNLAKEGGGTGGAGEEGGGGGGTGKGRGGRGGGWGGQWDADEVLRWARENVEVVQVAPINNVLLMCC
jgi:hypothetical protein